MVPHTTHPLSRSDHLYLKMFRTNGETESTLQWSHLMKTNEEERPFLPRVVLTEAIRMCCRVSVIAEP